MATFRWAIRLRLCASLLFLLECSNAVGASDTCAHFQEEAARIDANGGAQSQLAVGNATLCFPDFEQCSPGSISADKYWSGHPTHADTAALKGELLAYVGEAGYISRIAIAGRPVPIVRVARYVGSARCIRDTYLERAGSGYRIVRSPSLEQLSAEAGNCRGSYVFYRNWNGATFAILAEKAETWQGITVFQVDANLQFKSVCAKRNISPASNPAAGSVQ